MMTFQIRVPSVLIGGLKSLFHLSSVSPCLRGETVFSFFVLARPLSFRFHAYRPKSLCKPNLF